jgi:hypothetical protein
MRTPHARVLNAARGCLPLPASPLSPLFELSARVTLRCARAADEESDRRDNQPEHHAHRDPERRIYRSVASRCCVRQLGTGSRLAFLMRLHGLLQMAGRPGENIDRSKQDQSVGQIEASSLQPVTVQYPSVLPGINEQ